MPKVNTLFNYFSKSPVPDKSKSAVPDSGKCAYKNGDLVWSKLEGYPWWPSIVCCHPTLNIYFRNKEVHVQFFDSATSRAWIKLKNVLRYEGSTKGTVPTSVNREWQKGCRDADGAMTLSYEDRSMLIGDLIPTDEEDFDEDESDTSKENMNTNNTEMVNSHNVSRKLIGDSATPPAKKRCRIVEMSESEDEEILETMVLDDSEDEYKPTKEDKKESESDGSSGVDENDVSETEPESEVDSPVKVQKRKRKDGVTPSAKRRVLSNRPIFKPKTPSGYNSLFSPNVSKDTTSKLASFAAKETPSKVPTKDENTWKHLQLEFLKPDQIRDKNGRRPGDPEYNQRTLQLSKDFISKLTPAMRQWWEMKSKHFDTVLFFKVGKFYELYHMDAVIGVNELGLVFMKGENAHSGFPEIAYGRFSSALIDKGYKVARVEQTETPDMMNERCKKLSRPTKFDKVVLREICQISSKGTRTYNVQDGESRDMQNSYLLALTEKLQDETGDVCEYGVCFIDTSIGLFHLGQFSDDRHRSRLRTMLAHYPPAQVLYERGVLSMKTQQVMNSNLASVMKDALAPNTEFWSSEKTLKFLAEGDYFIDEDDKDAGIQWPEELKKLLDDADSLGLTVRDDGDLAVRALGACTWYLMDCCLDQEILSMRKFQQFFPVDHLPQQKQKSEELGKYMVLDGITLTNLDVVENSATKQCDGTLLERLDQCCTPFGKRLLRHWLCSPLCSVSAIRARQDAIADLLKLQEVVDDVRGKLRQLPDLERLLSKIHTQGNAARSRNHPDSRAIFYEDVVYSKRKILDFISTLNGFKTALDIVDCFDDKQREMTSDILIDVVTFDGDTGGRFPRLKKELEFFDAAFNHETAKKEGRIVPVKGVDKEFDSAVREIKNVNEEMKSYLDEQKKFFGCKVTYFGTDRNRFQLEVPESFAKKAGDEHELKSQKKGYKRFWTAETKEFLSRMMAAEQHKEAALRDIRRRIFEQFDKHYKKWNVAIQCLSMLDVLIALTQFSLSSEMEMCRPEIEPFSENVKPFIEIRNGRHPCSLQTFSGDDFIPNDTLIGEDSSLLLVTGPNMGGKSTLMRQVGLLTILAQIGCYIPAESCRLTPVDRVFTRLGASDRIMSGESTFYVELSETSAILQHATSHSLVLVDELGRGTATYDGTAIASAVVNELANIGCRTLFSTHYHTLVEQFSHMKTISLGHMACMVENECEDDPSKETITFLYKFAPGACPKSYGFNAARLAGIPDEIIKSAHQQAQNFERSVERKRLFRTIFKKESITTQNILSLCSMIKTK